MFEKRGKKAISPLIATVLLIAFAVAIGVMIMNWGKDVVARAGDCPDVQLEVQLINGKPMFCYDSLNNKINIMLKNTGTVDVKQLKLRVVTENFQADEKDVDDSAIKVGEVKPEAVSYSRPGKFRAEFIPAINFAGKDKICSGQAVVADNIAACS